MEKIFNQYKGPKAILKIILTTPMFCKIKIHNLFKTHKISIKLIFQLIINHIILENNLTLKTLM